MLRSTGQPIHAHGTHPNMATTRRLNAGAVHPKAQLGALVVGGARSGSVFHRQRANDDLGLRAARRVGILTRTDEPARSQPTEPVVRRVHEFSLGLLQPVSECRGLSST